MGIKLGNGKWATKEDELLAYRVIEGKYFDRSFDFARSSTTTRVNKDGYIEVVPSDTARIDYATSPEGALLTEPASTNLITYPISFGNSYWTKSGASIQGDPSTAGSELVTNGDFATDSDWGGSGSISGGQLTKTSGGLAYQSVVITSGTQYKIVVDVESLDGTTNIYAGGNNSEALSVGVQTIYMTGGSSNDWLGLNNGYSVGVGSVFNSISVKEVQGFEAPKEIPVANGVELVTNGDMELDSDWTDYFTPTTNERSGVRAHTGTYSRHIVGNDTYDGIKQDGIAMAQNSTYVCSAWVYVESGTVTMQVRATDTFHIIGSSSSASWVKLSGHFTSNSATLNQRVAFICDGAGGEFYVDDVSVKEATSYSGGGFEREAYKLVESTNTGVHSIHRSFISGISLATDYTWSVYAKADERNFISLVWIYGGSDNLGVQFNLTTGEKVYEYQNGTGYSVEAYSITALVDGWYKLTMTGQSGKTDIYPSIFLSDAQWTTGSHLTNTYTGTLGYGVKIAYSQMEQSSYASSLMLPTSEGSTTSRVADACTGSGTAQDFKDYNASGVLYAEIAALADDGVSNRLSISDGTIANRVFIGYNTSDEVWIMLNVGGAVRWQTTNAIDITVSHKIAVRWANEDFSLWVDGSEVDSQSSGTTLPANTLTELSFDDGGGGNDFYGKTKAIAVFDYLSDAEMSLLTSP